MKQWLLLCILVYTFASLYAQSADTSSEVIVRDFLKRDGINNKKTIYCGEMLSNFLNAPTLGQTLSPTVHKTYRLLSLQNTRAMYAVAIQNDGMITDWYMYLDKIKSKWKLDAVRTMALPGFFFTILRELGSNTARTADEEHTFLNMTLTASCDSVLKRYLIAHLDKFEQIAAVASTGKIDETTTLINDLHLSTVRFLPNNIDIIDISIGGIMDNSVGFLYIPNDTVPPDMSPNDYIFIEQIIDHWYIYRTT